jgi:hypothetical protein
MVRRSLDRHAPKSDTLIIVEVSWFSDKAQVVKPIFFKFWLRFEELGISCDKNLNLRAYWTA